MNGIRFHCINMDQCAIQKRTERATIEPESPKKRNEKNRKDRSIVICIGFQFPISNSCSISFFSNILHYILLASLTILYVCVSQMSWPPPSPHHITTFDLYFQMNWKPNIEWFICTSDILDPHTHTSTQTL